MICRCSCFSVVIFGGGSRGKKWWILKWKTKCRVVRLLWALEERTQRTKKIFCWGTLMEAKSSLKQKASARRKSETFSIVHCSGIRAINSRKKKSFKVPNPPLHHFQRCKWRGTKITFSILFLRCHQQSGDDNHLTPLRVLSLISWLLTRMKIQA